MTPFLKYTLIIGTAFLLLTLYQLFSSNGLPDTKPQAQSSASPAPVKSAEPSSGNELPSGTLDLAKQLEHSQPARNNIEVARNATVFIRTAWGLGSGFFISSDCTIVTNRHVVKIAEENWEAAEKKLASGEQALAQLREQIEIERKKFYSSCRDCSREALDGYLGRFEKLYDDSAKKLDEAQSSLNNVRYSDDLQVTLSDGTELEASVVAVSEEFDLALVKLNNPAFCPNITPGDIEKVQYGEKLYTIGSPIGLKHVVTSGVFSGFLKMEGKLMIQTDAPINPGNSGGPLINEDGQVLGINTLIIDKTEGIGFAIPVEVAFREFGL